MGEMRKALIARALMKSPKLLILDEPFDGLDDVSRHALADIINELMADSMRVILITHRFDEILPNITNVLFLKDGQFHTCGVKDEVFNQGVIQDVYGVQSGMMGPSFHQVNEDRPQFDIRIPPKIGTEKTKAGRTLIEMKNVTVKYADVVALEEFNWRVMSDENWVVLGPNGAGKSTALKLITGDNLQAYSNEVYLFGKKKGSGESIWEIKRNLGFISSELQVQYPGNFTAFEIVCSGFFDSVGLFRYCSAEQRELARDWIKTLGIDYLADQGFGKLSFGQRQLVLIARAMVKSPILLMLDEPCEGLDIANRANVLEVADYIGSKTDTSLIFVTHREEEILPCCTHKLELSHGRVKNMEALNRN